MDKSVVKVNKQHLPYPSGPYATGCMELMTEYSSEGCFARIFYPTDIPTEQLSEYSDKWVSWIPHEMYLKAFASTLYIPYFIFKYGPVILKLGPYFIPTISDALLSNKEQSYPLIIFSHGYTASRFVCSDYCNSLASHGFIVAAIEHRDGSAPITYYYDSPKSVEDDERTWIHHNYFHQYNDSDNNYTSKKKQLKMRHSECTKLLDTLLAINDGVPVKNVLKSSFQLSQFKNRIKTDKIITSGFSFGGATALYNASKDSRYKAVVVLDGWMFPLKSEPSFNIQQPLVLINSHTFHIPSNLNVLRKYFCSFGTRQLYTLKNTTHESHSDTAYLFGYWLDLLMLKKMEPKTALNLQSSLVIAFLRDTIGYPSNCDNAQLYIKEHSDDFVEDFISYTKKPKKKLGIYPW